MALDLSQILADRDIARRHADIKITAPSDGATPDSSLTNATGPEINRNLFDYHPGPFTTFAGAKVEYKINVDNKNARVKGTITISAYELANSINNEIMLTDVPADAKIVLHIDSEKDCLLGKEPADMKERGERAQRFMDIIRASARDLSIADAEKRGQKEAFRSRQREEAFFRPDPKTGLGLFHIVPEEYYRKLTDDCTKQAEEERKLSANDNYIRVTNPAKDAFIENYIKNQIPIEVEEELNNRKQLIAIKLKAKIQEEIQNQLKANPSIDRDSLSKKIEAEKKSEFYNEILKEQTDEIQKEKIALLYEKLSRGALSASPVTQRIMTQVDKENAKLESIGSKYRLRITSKDPEDPNFFQILTRKVLGKLESGGWIKNDRQTNDALFERDSSGLPKFKRYLFFFKRPVKYRNDDNQMYNKVSDCANVLSKFTSARIELFEYDDIDKKNKEKYGRYVDKSDEEALCDRRYFDNPNNKYELFSVNGLKKFLGFFFARFNQTLANQVNLEIDDDMSRFQIYAGNQISGLKKWLNYEPKVHFWNRKHNQGFIELAIGNHANDSIESTVDEVNRFVEIFSTDHLYTQLGRKRWKTSPLLNSIFSFTDCKRPDTYTENGKQIKRPGVGILNMHFLKICDVLWPKATVGAHWHTCEISNSVIVAGIDSARFDRCKIGDSFWFWPFRRTEIYFSNGNFTQPAGDVNFKDTTVTSTTNFFGRITKGDFLFTNIFQAPWKGIWGWRHFSADLTRMTEFGVRPEASPHFIFGKSLTSTFAGHAAY